MDTETLKTNVRAFEPEINDAEDSIADTEGDLSGEHQMIVEQLEKIMVEERTSSGIIFKKVNKNVLNIRIESVWVAQQIGLKKAEQSKENEPRWKRRIEGDIKRLRQEVNFLEREVKGELGLKKKRKKLRGLNERYRVKRKGLKTVIEELKQRMFAKSAKVIRYQQRTEQFRRNRIFNFDQKKMYAEFNGDGVRPSEVLNAEESKRFCG